MCRMGDWRNNKDEEMELDGIGGVNIIVKADVHRSGGSQTRFLSSSYPIADRSTQESTFLRTHSRTRPRQKGSQRWPSGPGMACTACPTMSCGTSTRRRREVTFRAFFAYVSVQRIRALFPVAVVVVCLSRAMPCRGAYSA